MHPKPPAIPCDGMSDPYQRTYALMTSDVIVESITSGAIFLVEKLLMPLGSIVAVPRLLAVEKAVLVKVRLDPVLGQPSPLNENHEALKSQLIVQQKGHRLNIRLFGCLDDDIFPDLT